MAEDKQQVVLTQEDQRVFADVAAVYPWWSEADVLNVVVQSREHNQSREHSREHNNK